MDEINKIRETSPDSGEIPKVTMKFDDCTGTWSHRDDYDVKNEPSTSGSVAQSDHHPSPASTPEDQEFELTADAMVHDFDDEATMEEEEEDGDGDDEELDDLAKERDIPLEDLIAMYYGKQENKEASETEKVEDGSSSDSREQLPKTNENKDSEELKRKLRSNATLLSPTHAESPDEDGDYVPPAPEDWRKDPRVGDEFQVMIPQCNNQGPDYNIDSDLLVWDPIKINQTKVESYLKEISDISTTGGLPNGCHLRDNEDALFLLTQCNNDTEEAIRQFRWKPRPLSSELQTWSEEECRLFEHGLSLYGKDFHNIHHNKVRTKSIGEIVKFYYIWKKSEHYDKFNAKTRLGKKKDTLHPGVTDYMERLLDETEHSISMHHTASGGQTTPHSVALQQHLVDLRVTRSHARQRPSNFADSPTNQYGEINGFLDGDYADDIEIFDNIVPSLPTSSAPTSGEYSTLEPEITVVYSEPAHFAPISSSINHEAIPAGILTSNRNNNSDKQEDSSRSFRPVEPAQITPSLENRTHEGTRTTPLPQDVLTSIDELVTAYCTKPTSKPTSKEPPQTPDPTSPTRRDTQDEHGAKRRRIDDSPRGYQPQPSDLTQEKPPLVSC
ncbi:mesoderm induction early response protein 1 [Ciona intestinalis]